MEKCNQLITKEIVTFCRIMPTLPQFGCSENRRAGVSPAGARAFLRSAQDRLCPCAGAGRSRDRGRDARATSASVRFSWFLGARQPTGMSDCFENRPAG